MVKWNSGTIAASALVAGLFIGTVGTIGVLRAEGYSIGFHQPSGALQKFNTAFTDISRGYYRKVPDNKLVDGAISGMLGVLNDPFTDYFNPEQAKQFQNMLSSSMVGIGVQIEEHSGYPRVASVFASSPAASAGIQSGDTIISVNGSSLHGLTLAQVAQRIEGPKGTVVSLGIKRGTKSLDVKVKRAEIVKPSVSGKMLNNHIGYMRISVVAAKTGAEVKSEMTKLKAEGARKLVLDLRGNPGGYLNQAVQAAGQFLPAKAVVVKTVNRAGHTTVLRSPGPGSKLPVVILINKGTASAAEILAAALHDDRSIPLIGTQSFGKGTAQVTDSFPDGSELKYTVEKWLTPNNTWINKKGLTPQEVVQLQAGASMGNQKSDTQLAAAIKWLADH